MTANLVNPHGNNTEAMGTSLNEVIRWSKTVNLMAPILAPFVDSALNKSEPMSLDFLNVFGLRRVNLTPSAISRPGKYYEFPRMADMLFKPSNIFS